MSAIRELPDNFFRCEHGYEHYSNCPLCSQATPSWSGGAFDHDKIADVDEFFGDSVSAEDKAAILSVLSSQL